MMKGEIEAERREDFAQKMCDFLMEQGFRISVETFHECENFYKELIKKYTYGKSNR